MAVVMAVVVVVVLWARRIFFFWCGNTLCRSNLWTDCVPFAAGRPPRRVLLFCGRAAVRRSPSLLIGTVCRLAVSIGSRGHPSHNITHPKPVLLSPSSNPNPDLRGPGLRVWRRTWTWRNK